jgi:hypothetical protein
MMASKRKKIKKTTTVCLVYSVSPSQDNSIIVTINKSKTIFKSQKQY